MESGIFIKLKYILQETQKRTCICVVTFQDKTRYLSHFSEKQNTYSQKHINITKSMLCCIQTTKIKSKHISIHAKIQAQMNLVL